MPKLLAIDSETTGLDSYHEARPFYITTCDEDGNQRCWEWAVDPYSRHVEIPEADVVSVRKLIESAERLVFANAKFDITMLERIGVYPGDTFPWEKTEDIIIGHHTLYSAYRHGLDAIVVQYFGEDGEDINALEDAIGEATQECRRLCRTKRFIDTHGKWLIGQSGLRGHPSIGASKSGKETAKSWKPDMWLPRCVAEAMEYPPDHPYWSVLEEYADPDSRWTLECWLKIEAELERKGLTKIYRARMEAIPAAHEMERRGVTGSLSRMNKLVNRFETEREQQIRALTARARQWDYDLALPRSGNNQNLLTFVFDVMELPVLKRTETGAPSFDKDVIDQYEKELDDGSERDFISTLLRKRNGDTALQYVDGYRRYWHEEGDAFRINPNLNPTGTVQLRWSHNNPNSGNISKKEGYNLREGFGPLPDEEWWSLDYQNVELRIPSYASGEPKLIEVFEKPKEAPYFGSYHLVVFDALHPEKFAEFGAKVKEEYESTEYQWVKNGDFAVIYGAGKRKVDATFHVPGAYDLVRDRFPKIAELADRQLWHAKRHGYVETIPDRSVDAARGFRIMAGRTDDGGILPTTPLNYFVSGTAMWVTGRSMARCHNQFKEWRAGKTPIDGRMVLQVHDELVFALPRVRTKQGNPIDDEATKALVKGDLENEKQNGRHLSDTREYKSNLGRVRVLQRLMEQGGTDIGVPTPVGVELNLVSWDKVDLKA